MTFALADIWHFLFGWASIAILVGIGATALALLEPAPVAVLIPDLRKWAIAVAVVAFSFTLISGKYYDDGLTEKQSQWDAAAKQEIVNGDKARADAVVTVGPVPTDRSVFAHDARNRDSKQPAVKPKSKMPRLAPAFLFRK